MTTETVDTEIQSLRSQIKSIETQLAMLKARLERLGATAPKKTFADFYGILAGQADFSDEEIDAALYRLDWDDDEPEETAG